MRTLARPHPRRSLHGTPPVLPDLLRGGHRRIKQYTNAHKKTHGGANLVVDEDVIDGPVARVG